MEFDAAQARRNISIEFVDKDYSKFSVFPVVASYLLDYLHLDREFKAVLKVRNHNSSFSGAEYLLFLFTIIFLGIAHIYKADDLLETEYQLAKILGFNKERFPTASSLYRLLGRVDHWVVKRLDQVNLTLIKRHRDYLGDKRWLVADIDQTKKLTEGVTIEKAKPCYDKERKGKLGLKISQAQVEGLIFSQKLEPGNVGNAECFPKLFMETLSKLNKISSPLKNKRVKDKKIILRIDGGYFSRETLQLLDGVQRRRRLDFVIRAKSNLKLLKEKKKNTKRAEWQTVDREMRVLRLTNQLVLLDHPTAYTVLVIRDKQQRIRSKNKRVYRIKKQIEYVLVTTLSHWHAKRIVAFYKRRQQIENLFRDFNQSFKADKLPTHTFWGNALYFQMVAFVANVTFFLSRHLSPGGIKTPPWKLSGTSFLSWQEKFLFTNRLSKLNSLTRPNLRLKS